MFFFFGGRGGGVLVTEIFGGFLGGQAIWKMETERKFCRREGGKIVADSFSLVRKTCEVLYRVHCGAS